MRRFEQSCWLLLVLLLAVPVATAHAAGPDTARICGSENCVTVTGAKRVDALALQDGFSPRDAPRPGAFYTVELTSSRLDDIRWLLLYVPSRRAVRVNTADFTLGLYPEPAREPYWVTPAGGTLSTFAGATRGLEPFAAPDRWQPPAEDGGRDWTTSLLIAGAAVAVAVAILRARRRGSRGLARYSRA